VLERRARQGDDEFLAPVAGDQVVAPSRLAEDGGDSPEDQVSEVVPVGVVDPLEIVEDEPGWLEGSGARTGEAQIWVFPLASMSGLASRRDGGKIRGRRSGDPSGGELRPAQVMKGVRTVELPLPAVLGPPPMPT
jgi:hypothetical protein